MAIEAYLGAYDAPPGQQLENCLRDWFAATERHALQLHEIDENEYFEMKRREVVRPQQTAVRLNEAHLGHRATTIMPFRFPKFGPTTGVFLGLVVVLGVGAALFDWNWFRHPLERYLIDRSHREVRIGDLHVDLGFSLEPTVRVRDVHIENAPWASKEPAAVVGEASFTFSLRSLWEGRPVISRLVLIDADVQLEMARGRAEKLATEKSRRSWPGPGQGAADRTPSHKDPLHSWRHRSRCRCGSLGSRCKRPAARWITPDADRLQRGIRRHAVLR